MTTRAAAVVVAVTLLLCAAAPAAPSQPLDSQYVLQRYALAVDAIEVPKNVVFTYSVTQLGPATLDQRHRMYRSGDEVRDETIASDGLALTHKAVTISRREDRYAVARLAPRVVNYQMLFLRAVPDGAHLDYVYEVTPLLRQSGAAVDRIAIDGTRFLPRSIRFRTAGNGAQGTGEVRYAPFGQYWMPVLATVDASVGGKPAHERIAFGEYRFPESLPLSTFQRRPEPAGTQ